MSATNANAINFFSPARWVVSKLAGEGTHTPISAALAAASNGDTIVIMEGTYTENNVLSKNVQFVGLAGSDMPTIVGKFSMTTANQCTFTNLTLQTNSDYCLSITGSTASVMIAENCYINATNNTPIQLNSSSSAVMQFYNCTGGAGTSGIALFSSSTTGSLVFNNCYIGNQGYVTTTASTFASSGTLFIFNSNINWAITTSGTSSVQLFNNGNLGNLVIGGTGINYLFNSFVGASGGVSAISVGTGASLSANLVSIYSNATNAITGAGTINYSGISFLQGSSTLINTTTQVGGILQGGVTQAPSAGFIGEQIASTIAPASAVNLSNGSVVGITSISLTPGVWDISVVAGINANGATVTANYAGVSPTSGTLAASHEGDTWIYGPVATSVIHGGITIPAFRTVLTATTSYYLNIGASFTVATAKGFGRISGTRVG